VTVTVTTVFNKDACALVFCDFVLGCLCLFVLHFSAVFTRPATGNPPFFGEVSSFGDCRPFETFSAASLRGRADGWERFVSCVCLRLFVSGVCFVLCFLLFVTLYTYPLSYKLYIHTCINTCMLAYIHTYTHTYIHTYFCLYTLLRTFFKSHFVFRCLSDSFQNKVLFKLEGP
jgi:hypothetical protein